MEENVQTFIQHLEQLDEMITKEAAVFAAQKAQEHEAEGSSLEKLVETGKNIGKAATDNMVARFMAKRLGVDKLGQAGIKALTEAGVRLDSPLMKQVLASEEVGEQMNQIVSEYKSLELPKKIKHDRKAPFYVIIKAHNDGDFKAAETAKGKAMQMSRKLASGGMGAFNSLRKGKVMGVAASILNSGTDFLKTALGRDTAESRLRLLLLQEMSEICKRREPR